MAEIHSRSSASARTRTARRPRSPTRSPSTSPSQLGASATRRCPPPREQAQRTRPQRRAAHLARCTRASGSSSRPGRPKQRSNDTDYPYRAHSAFAHLTGWGSDSVPDSVLVFEPTARRPRRHPVLPRARRPRHRRVLREPRDRRVLDRPAPGARARRRRPRRRDEGARRVRGRARRGGRRHARRARRRPRHHRPGRRAPAARRRRRDARGRRRRPTLARDLSELRLVKDEFEIAQMRAAVAATERGFDDVIADLPDIVAHPRGERIVEGVFNRRARADGNTVGYDTIAASGPHACYPALDPQRRAGRARRPDPDRRRRRGRQPLHRRHHPHAAGERHVQPTCSARSTRPCARRRTPRSRS